MHRWRDAAALVVVVVVVASVVDDVENNNAISKRDDEDVNAILVGYFSVINFIVGVPGRPLTMMMFRLFF